MEYKSISFSDHLALLCSFTLPSEQGRYIPPKARPPRRIPPHIVEDQIFKTQIQEMMNIYNQILENGANILIWWENLVKPGIIEVATQRKKKINEESMHRLNLLHLLQGRYTSNLLKGIVGSYEELLNVNQEIQEWYQQKCQIAVQKYRKDEICQNEKIRIFHLAENKRLLKKRVW